MSYVCGNCEEPIKNGQQFCDYCGEEVDWDDYILPATEFRKEDTKPAGWVPRLFTLNGCGTSLYGETICFTLLFVPIFWIGRYLVTLDLGNNNSYIFHAKKKLHRWQLVWNTALLTLIIVLITLGVSNISFSSSGDSGGGSRVVSNSANTNQSDNNEIPEFGKPAQPLPSNGEVKSYIQGKHTAPLSIKTSSGDNYYYVLLKMESGFKALSVFIYPGKTVDIDVPLGKYYLYYATGKEWYGTENLFGPDTVYSKADDIFIFYEANDYVNGYTVELIPRRGGNLSTSSASSSDFS
ncbi:MAG: zinc ribbon domain-containing protein [Coriobacteriales bacterium]|jgi:hypothetical protein|nr:zinc ribbon domain-containing protein [Coriobacteriales bacterium]